jgi:Gamma-glutamyl cyclotransferase, AIG2-like
MTIDETPTELLFSYGTLQLEAVQMAAFGRLLSGSSDALSGFELAPLKIEDEAVIAISGKTHHTIARLTGRATDVVTGTVFRVTPDDIQHADKYEVDACKRIAVTLQSGVHAWVYVEAQH